ncbi:FkbM family methyltransferase [Oceaniglobus ichthyenteri]|uniref:FkbM family methyltransferase n=1 Tax=Oceaniglobus ichthyenteri TaxID=2136177 RepID=UPI000D3D1660|nr:FkbM family methyltransferase [Oceaniglobus ichthyenteri]
MSEIPPETEKSKAELRAEKLMRRQQRNMHKATAEGFMAGVCAMLRPGDTVLDCGANMGVVTAQLAATPAQVIAYEPDPFAFSHLSSRFINAHNVTLINAAVAASPGTVNLMRAENFDENPQGASVKSTILAGGRSIDSDTSIEVACLSFLDILREKADPTRPLAFVKMDIEGAELEILEAMLEQDLFGHVRCLVAETHERKFKALRPRFRALRSAISERFAPSHVNLDWI